MKIRAQVGMMLNLDKCIGCHTCSVTCKQVVDQPALGWSTSGSTTSRPGPASGYPQAATRTRNKWKGGWTLNRRGRLTLKAAPGREVKKLLMRIFSNPLLPNIKDYYEPWTYDYEHAAVRTLELKATTSTVRAAEVADHRQADEQDRVELRTGTTILGGEFSKRSTAISTSIGFEQVRQEASDKVEVRLRERLHVLPAAHLRALPQPRLRRERARRGRCTSAPRTASCWSTRTRAGAGGCASPGVRTRRSTSTGPHRQGREVHRSATPGSRSGCRRCAARPASAGMRYIGAGPVRRRPGPG